MDPCVSIRIPRHWLRIGLIVLIVAALIAPVAVYAAGGSFTDDDTSIFEADIEWLADSGVTAGCNPPTNDHFCPNDSVTRGQMAAFIHRLAVNQVVDAGLLGGESADHYESAVWANDLGGLNPDPFDMTNQTWAEITVDAATSGFLLINSTASLYDPTSDASALLWIQVDDTACVNTSEHIHPIGYGYGFAPTGKRASAAITGAVPVDAGPHTVTLCGRSQLGGGDTQLYGPVPAS